MPIAQTAHVRLDQGPPSERLHLALNSVLPEDIRVLSATTMSPEFHARFSARGKRYVYRVGTSRVLHPMLRRYVHAHGRDVDLVGDAGGNSATSRHSRLPRASPPTREYHASARPFGHLQAVHLLPDRAGFALWVQGDGFLYNMVRILAGTLLEVGKGKLAP